MDLCTIRMKELDAEELVGQVFVTKSTSYRILGITKTWGESPVILGYFQAQDHNGNIQDFLMKCRLNFPNTDWLITISEKQ